MLKLTKEATKYTRLIVEGRNVTKSIVWSVKYPKFNSRLRNIYNKNKNEKEGKESKAWGNLSLSLFLLFLILCLEDIKAYLALVLSCIYGVWGCEIITIDITETCIGVGGWRKLRVDLAHLLNPQLPACWFISFSFL